MHTNYSVSECKKEEHLNILLLFSKPLTMSALTVSSNKKPPNQKNSNKKPFPTKILLFYRNPINKKWISKCFLIWIFKIDSLILRNQLFPFKIIQLKNHNYFQKIIFKIIKYLIINYLTLNLKEVWSKVS